MKQNFCIGIMSGTSIDGIDIVIAQFSNHKNFIKYKLLHFKHYNFPPEIRDKIFFAMNNKTSSVQNICQLNFDLAYLYAKSVNNLLKKNNLKPTQIFVIGSHGQTIYHIPKGTIEDNKKLTPSTLQIGDGSIIAELTGITTVSDFRTRDIAVGGQGAPLVPFADYHFFTHPKKNLILQNIGGIANSTFLKANGKISDVIAFDNGPGNMMIDYAVSKFTNEKMKFDTNGKLAQSGSINYEWLNFILNNPYFKKKPPKSTGREMFGSHYVESLIKKFKIDENNFKDFIATLTFLTAKTITDSYKNFILNRNIVDEIILSGGGAKNPSLVKMMKNLLPEIKITKIESKGLNSSAKEALAFALLAYTTILNIPNNIPSATGAKKRVVLGKISKGTIKK